LLVLTTMHNSGNNELSRTTKASSTYIDNITNIETITRDQTCCCILYPHQTPTIPCSIQRDRIQRANAPAIPNSYAVSTPTSHRCALMCNDAATP
jgi:hypothetical protein